MLETSEKLFKFSIKNQTKAFGENWEVGGGCILSSEQTSSRGKPQSALGLIFWVISYVLDVVIASAFG